MIFGMTLNGLTNFGNTSCSKRFSSSICFGDHRPDSSKEYSCYLGNEDAGTTSTKFGFLTYISKCRSVTYAKSKRMKCMTAASIMSKSFLAVLTMLRAVLVIGKKIWMKSATGLLLIPSHRVFLDVSVFFSDFILLPGIHLLSGTFHR